MADFNDILKKGQSAAIPESKLDPQQEWKDAVGRVLNGLQILNGLYGNNKAHHIHYIERVSCYTCGDATYLITVCEKDNPNEKVTFHLGDWESTLLNSYFCEKCKTKAP